MSLHMPAHQFSRWVRHSRLFKTIRNRVRQYITDVAIAVFKEREAGHEKEMISRIGALGPNSFFWGDRHFVSKPENLKIGENVHINSNCFIKSEGGVSIGDNTHISRNLVLYTVNHDFNGKCLPYDENFLEGPVAIGKNVWIGMNVCIAPGTTIGDGVIVGMGTTVSGDVPPLSIIGSQKWRVLGRRDKQHYQKLEKYGKYGAANGGLYTDYQKTLDKVGDRKTGTRSTIDVIPFKQKKAVKKLFHDTDEGRIALNKELEAIDTFGDCKWFPGVLEKCDSYVTYEYYPNSERLDQVVRNADESKKARILHEIIFALLDIFVANFAHCDFHTKNMFYSCERGLKIIDFESLQAINSNIDFFESYDVTGKGLESPYRTGNMCIFNELPTSISNSFGIKSIGKFKELVEQTIRQRLFEISSSFHTRRYDGTNRHNLKHPLIYSTVDTKYVRIGADIGQRNVAKRFEQFSISRGAMKNKSVLDIGSNIGGTLFEVCKHEPSKAIGVECDLDKVSIANKIAKLNGLKNVTFVQQDVESRAFIDSFNEAFDVVFCLALLEHLGDRGAFLKKMTELCEGELYFEGNAGSDVKFVVNSLKRHGFKVVQYLGLSSDEIDKENNVRPLIYARKSKKSS